MNAQSFLDNFHTIARAPGGVSRMRELVYFFAITGGLSRPEAGDSDANLILDDSLQAKLEYYEENSVRQGARKHSEIFQVVKRVPNHWVMVSAGDLIHLINGRAFKSTDWRKSGLPIIRIQNLNNATAPFNYFQGEVSEGHRVRAGDMLLSWSGTPGTSFGAFIWNGGDAVLNQHIFKVAIYSSKISKEYLRMAINASLDALIGSARGGVGLKHVTKGQIESLQIPLPPLEEQKRIVAKVDELMRLCDRLEAQQQEREKLLPLISRANHTRFVTQPIPSNLEIIFHPSGLTSPEDLRLTVLLLATQGKLVDQDSDAEPVDSLLTTIDAERQRLIAAKQLRKSVPRESAAAAEIQKSIPNTWRVVRLEDITKGISDGVHKKPRYTATGVPFVTIRDLTAGPGISFDGVKFISETDHAEFIKRTHPERGDILITKDGTIGVVRIVETDRRFSIFVSVALVKPVVPETNRYLAMVFQSPVFQNQINPKGAALQHLHLVDLRNLLVPLPPLEEQTRIVARVEELMRAVDRLNNLHCEQKDVATSFATAAVAAITSTEFAENEMMKPPKTEVVTALKVGTKPKNSDAAALAALIANHNEFPKDRRDTQGHGTHVAGEILGTHELTARELWQLSGLDIDAFYRQLKIEMANGWIEEDTLKRAVKEVEVG